MDKKTMAVWLIGFIFIFLISLVIVSRTSKLFLECDIKDIEYRDISKQGINEEDASCYASFSDRYCPMPKEIHCKFQGDLFGIIFNILGGID